MAELTPISASQGTSSSFQLSLEPSERALLGLLPDRLRRFLESPNESPKVLDRLFPPTYRNAGELESEHRRLLGADLLDRRKDALRRFEKMLSSRRRLKSGATILSEIDVDILLSVLNDFRLLLASSNGFDTDAPDIERIATPAGIQDYIMLHALGSIQGDILEGLGYG